MLCATSASQRARRTSEQPLEGLVEAPHATESGRQSNVGDGQLRFLQQLLGEKDAPGLRHSDRGCAEMLSKQAAQLALSGSQPLRELFYVALVQRAEFDQRQATRHRVRCASPSAAVRGCFRTAA